MSVVLLKLSAMVQDTNMIIHTYIWLLDILQKDNYELFFNAAVFEEILLETESLQACFCWCEIMFPIKYFSDIITVSAKFM